MKGIIQKICYLIMFIVGTGLTIPMVFANDDAHVKYADATVAFLSAQIDQLEKSNSLLRSRGLTDQELFELIGEPSFSAINEALIQQGFSVQTFYQYRSDNEVEFAQWLLENKNKNNEIDGLMLERKRLLKEYDSLNNVGANGTTN